MIVAVNRPQRQTQRKGKLTAVSTHAGILLVLFPPSR